MQREIVSIDNEKCDGCGLCIPNCHEGALQIIDGKAVLISDLFCDGLGACLGHCPTGAITIEKREAEPYDEIKVISEMIDKGKNVVFAHLKHLSDHQENVFLQQGMNYLVNYQDQINFNVEEVLNSLKNKTMIQNENNGHMHEHGGCPGSMNQSFAAAPGRNPIAAVRTAGAGRARPADRAVQPALYGRDSGARNAASLTQTNSTWHHYVGCG